MPRPGVRDDTMPSHSETKNTALHHHGGFGSGFRLSTRGRCSACSMVVTPKPEVAGLGSVRVELRVATRRAGSRSGDPELGTRDHPHALMLRASSGPMHASVAVDLVGDVAGNLKRFKRYVVVGEPDSEQQIAPSRQSLPADDGPLALVAAQALDLDAPAVRREDVIALGEDRGQLAAVEVDRHQLAKVPDKNLATDNAEAAKLLDRAHALALSCVEPLER